MTKFENPSDTAPATNVTISAMSSNSEVADDVRFADFGLSEDILRALSDQGYVHPTPIQAAAIPVVLEGRDVMGAAQTGTGKTAGFSLPIIQLLLAHANAKIGRAHV